MYHTIRALYLIIIFAVITACGDESSTTDGTSQPDTSINAPKTPQEAPKPVQVPAFNKDSAYAFVAKQVAFGPRVPGSDEIEACRQWMISKLESYGADVIRQDFNASYHHGETHPAANIVGQFNPGIQNRVVLAAHYDTRYIAEQDADESRQQEPILGADDGASGVGVLMEIARLISENEIDLGVDIVFFDAEDQGLRGGGEETLTTWCIGSQYWSRQPHRNGYSADFGILLDMVGAGDAYFNIEKTRGVYRNADEITNVYRKVWSLAKAMGKGRYFQNQTVSGIIDDHYFVNTISGIPMIDIINKPPGAEHGFGDHWHTHNDNMDIISRETLGAVGQVVTAVVYRHSGGAFL